MEPVVMKYRLFLILSLLISSATSTTGAVLQRSDVVFMYQADAKTYADYGATVLAWGGKPTPKSLEQGKGVKFFGSVGMVTEFSRFYERFPKNYEEGLCRDVKGQPVKVPWLTDHQHKGIPYWWCCTRQPLFRQYLRERVVETIQAGAEGLHIDDHLGTAGGLWLGTCFCDRCVAGFRDHLKTLPVGELPKLGIDHPEGYDFRAAVQQWIAAEAAKPRKPTEHPLWSQWTIYQCRSAAAFMQELHELANQTAGRAIPMGANAGLLWPRHLGDYRTLDLFSAETDHHASARRFSEAPIFAYRLADAVQRPYAATASGGDWAYIKEHNLPGLVRGWIALSYAAGHSLMAPHRQWCYTPEKGTHWFQGPAEKFAPLYQFVRRHAELLNDYENYADLALVMPHRAFLKNPTRWFTLANRLTAAHLSYRLILGGDEIVDHPIRAEELDNAKALFIPDRDELLPADRALVEKFGPNRRVFATVEDVMQSVRPAVQVRASVPFRALPRVKTGGVVIHLLNYDYDPGRDDVRPANGVHVSIDTGALGIAADAIGRLVSADGPEAKVGLKAGIADLPTLGLWSLLILETSP